MGKKAKAKARANAEQFGTVSIGDPAFAAWIAGTTVGEKVVTPYTVLGLSAVLRAVSIISTTIAGLPLRSYERQGDDRKRIPSVFDDPYPGIDGQTPFAWSETVLIHLLLWRKAFLWHEAFASDGTVTAYRPLLPDAITKVERINGRKRFTYNEKHDDGTTSQRVVGSEAITHIPGPSLDGADGHPMLAAARAIFQGAMAGDEAASKTLAQGIRLGALLTPGEGEDIDPTEGETILEQLRPKLVGPANTGGIAFINRRLKLDPWTPTNIESQWHEAKSDVNGEVGRLFGIPPHLLNDIEKQSSWGTGIAEQNLGLARYTLMGWSSRIEQVLSIRLPGSSFCEYDYKGLLQGTPAEELRLLIEQVDAGILTPDEARKILNLPPLTAKQKADVATRQAPTRPTPLPVRQEATA